MPCALRSLAMVLLAGALPLLSACLPREAIRAAHDAPRAAPPGLEALAAIQDSRCSGTEERQRFRAELATFVTPAAALPPKPEPLR